VKAHSTKHIENFHKKFSADQRLFHQNKDGAAPNIRFL
jgi:hypothetical protein